jgi:hypothetical protein
VALRLSSLELGSVVGGPGHTGETRGACLGCEAHPAKKAANKLNKKNLGMAPF